MVPLSRLLQLLIEGNRIFPYQKGWDMLVSFPGFCWLLLHQWLQQGQHLCFPCGCSWIWAVWWWMRWPRLGVSGISQSPRAVGMVLSSSPVSLYKYERTISIIIILSPVVAVHCIAHQGLSQSMTVVTWYPKIISCDWESGSSCQLSSFQGTRMPYLTSTSENWQLPWHFSGPFVWRLDSRAVLFIHILQQIPNSSCTESPICSSGVSAYEISVAYCRVASMASYKMESLEVFVFKVWSISSSQVMERLASLSVCELRFYG